MSDKSETSKISLPANGKKESKEANIVDSGAESLSTKLSSLPIVTSSLQSVSETCHYIKKSNSLVKYGFEMAEKALCTGKAVLESKPLAPITNLAIDQVCNLDKEAGSVVDKLWNSDEKVEKPRICETKDEQQDAPTPANIDVVVQEESSFYFMCKTIVRMTAFVVWMKFKVLSFFVYLPWTIPSYMFWTIIGFLGFGSCEERGQKRKDRGSMSGESTCMEPSNVKRKYGDRQSTSSEEGTLIQIYSTNYVGRKDPDYVPEEHETEESSEDSGNEEEKEEQRKEALHLTDQMVKEGIPLCKEIKANMKEIEKKMNKKANDAPSLSGTGIENLATKPPTGKPTVAKESIEKVSNRNASPMEEISLKEHSSEAKEESLGTEKAEAEVEKGGKEIDQTRKSRRSSKSPLLERLLSPGRRSRRSKKDKAKPESETTEISDEVSKKSDESTKSKALSASPTASSDNAKTPKKHDDTSKSDVKEENASLMKGGPEKSEIPVSPSELETKASTAQVVNESLRAASGPFDVFKFGKKSK